MEYPSASAATARRRSLIAGLALRPRLSARNRGGGDGMSATEAWDPRSAPPGADGFLTRAFC